MELGWEPKRLRLKGNQRFKRTIREWPDEEGKGPETRFTVCKDEGWRLRRLGR